MTERHVHVEIEAVIEGAALSGLVTSGRTVHRFAGRLALLTAIDRVLENDGANFDADGR